MLRSKGSKILVFLFFAIAMVSLGWMLLRDTPMDITTSSSGIPRNALELAKDNYHEDARRAALAYDLPYEYLMALAVLECSGKKPAGTRFEKKVFERLLQVKKGDRRKYENVKKRHLEDASDEAVRNLATSWGPFQLMGYKCIGMEVNVADIRGEDAMLQGARWISEEYGHLLNKDKFKDAFHYHNTGRKYPRNGKPTTHDPTYVSRGLEYMKYFSKKN
ncbi:MAG: hypothetical protein AAF193_03320 [Bacteroidota bacterium]